MHQTVRRHLGKVLAGAAIAVTGTAVMIGITLPDSAGADDAAGARGTGRAAVAGSAQGDQGDRNGQAGQDGQGGQGAAGGAPEPGIVEGAAADGEQGIGRDPLTDDELERVEKLAMTPAQFAGGQNVEGDRGPQHLATNLSEPEPSEADVAAPPRRAEVSYYDYKSDELVTKTVNLATGKVERSSTVQGVQPSPNPREVREAAELILGSPLGDGLKKDYRDATGKPLTSVDQLQVNGGVYRQEREAQVPAALGKCGEHRCVRITSKVKNGPWIDTQHLVVDLSARTVGRTD
ncbi:Tat pathway signal sequence domain protein [Streptomyces sp. H27-C3]|uniref:Tat pathway signal sequence domain protein n=1 Tax=Streptomyces sp. H27-C3 TaxID=3046305 RepID=UPI0024BAC516|nr:Tat pathway signal sequence domain protein [Streptomyces sp. H27-C3]MDJ0464174.1 Tat pathway signal sequence domain protein [Streptomyces sp. H27-C3]